MEFSSLVLIGCGMLLSIQETHAATRVDAHKRAEETVGKRSFRLEGLPRRSVANDEIIARTVRELFSLQKEESLEATDRSHTAQGTDVWRFKETYMGLEVLEAGVAAETDTSGRFTGDAMGTLIENIDEDMATIEPVVSRDRAFHLCLVEANLEMYENIIPEFNATLVVHLDDSNIARLTYFIDSLIETDDLRQRPNCLIDAQDGLVYRSWNAIESTTVRFNGVGGNNKTGKILYDEYHRLVSVKKEGSVCSLENENVKVVNMNFSTEFNVSEAYSFDCDKFDDEVNGGYAPALDAFYYGNVVYKMFTTWYNMRPLDLPKIVLRVHFGQHMEDAFWDGATTNLGDGLNKFYPLTSLDVVGHEIGHGFTEHHSGLLYFEQSGGLSEAFSDMTGETAEHFLHSNDWMIGAELIKSATAFRYFEDPSLDNVSISHVSNYSDGMDVHHSSGIFNHIFYQIAETGSFHIKDVYHMFLLANRMYWHHLSTFESAACDLIKSAYDLGFDLGVVENAIRSVGLTGCDITKHIRHLRRNVSVDQVTVSNVSSPVFAFGVPPWAVNFTVVGEAEGGVLVVTVHNETFGNPQTYLWKSDWSNDRAYLEINTPPPGRLMIKLATENGNYLEKVTIRVDYDCAAVEEDRFNEVGYWHDCLFKDELAAEKEG